MKEHLKIRTNYLLLVLLLVLSLPANAQDADTDPAETSYYGLKAGVNFAELWGDDAIPESDRKVGYSFGVYACYKISGELSIQPEVIWSLQGQKSSDKGRYKISYINIPVMLKWTHSKLYTELGPQLGLLTISTSESVPEDIRLDDFETFDLSINAGIGYQILEDMTLGLRYSEGLTNIAPGRDLRNSVIYIGISYKLF